MDGLHLPGHADHMDVLSQLSDERWPSISAVHEQVLGIDTATHEAVDHGFHEISGFAQGFQPPFVSAASLVHLFDGGAQRDRLIVEVHLTDLTRCTGRSR